MDLWLDDNGDVRHHIVLVALLADRHVKGVSALLLLRPLLLRFVALRLVLGRFLDFNGDLLFFLLVNALRRPFLGLLKLLQLLFLLLIRLQLL